MSTPDTVNFSFERPVVPTYYIYGRYIPAPVYNALVAASWPATSSTDGAFPRVYAPAVDTTVRVKK
jgi:hypothetical protein